MSSWGRLFSSLKKPFIGRVDDGIGSSSRIVETSVSKQIFATGGLRSGKTSRVPLLERRGGSPALSAAPPAPRLPAVVTGTSSSNAGSSTSRAPLTGKTSVSSARRETGRLSASRIQLDAPPSDSDVEMSVEEEQAGSPNPYDWLPEDELECDKCYKRIKCSNEDPRIRYGWTCDACRGRAPSKTTSAKSAKPVLSTAAAKPAKPALSTSTAAAPAPPAPASHRAKPKPRPRFFGTPVRIAREVLEIDTGSSAGKRRLASQATCGLFKLRGPRDIAASRCGRSILER
ncbi:hypothetical protein BV20DRAFT_981838 [Pilatotrama ljubarskyi]|nr:hypothetical protein BV20DRAFT_981838 [Pilatotrama ljubarskyi]